LPKGAQVHRLADIPVVFQGELRDHAPGVRPRHKAEGHHVHHGSHNEQHRKQDEGRRHEELPALLLFPQLGYFLGHGYSPFPAGTSTGHALSGSHRTRTASPGASSESMPWRLQINSPPPASSTAMRSMPPAKLFSFTTPARP